MGAPEGTYSTTFLQHPLPQPDNNKFIPSEVDQFKNSPKRDNAEDDKAESSESSESSEKKENTVKKDDKQSGFVENREDGGAKLVEESSDNEEGGAKL